MRTKKSFRNILVAFINNILNIILGIVVQKVFLSVLGEEYLGLNGVFSNVLSLLAVAELGIGTAIIFKMYKPIHEKNYQELRKLMLYYKKCYIKILIVMTTIVLAIIPFLHLILGNTSNIRENIYLLYILFSIDILFSYILSYKKSILYADQKEYVSNIVHLGYLILMNGLQIYFLLSTKEYLIFLIIKIVCRVLENIIISIIVNKKYPFLKDGKEELSISEKKDITKRIKFLFVHKMAGFVVTGTDTILISVFLGGLATVGYYSNYNLIVSSVTTVFNQIFISMTSSIGNLLVTEQSKKRLEVFHKIQFLDFWLFTFASVCIFCLIEPFITIWIGSEYLLSKFVLISLVLNFYMQGMRRCMMSFKEAAGIFYEDRFIPIIESLINLVASIIFLKLFGLPGVFLGTIASTLIVYLYSYPKCVYKPLFDDKGINYVKLMTKYLIISGIVLSITYGITTIFTIANPIIKLLVNLVICIIVPNIGLLIIYYKNPNLKYYLNLVKKIIKKTVNR